MDSTHTKYGLFPNNFSLELKRAEEVAHVAA